MLYLAIPAHNEVATIGVLLWRIRTVLAEFPREYEVVVYDDASTDDTAAVAEQYERAMPVTVLRGTTRLGYAGAADAVLRHVAQRTRYPRRDAVLLLQGDFTDPPVVVPEFARRFEGGADLVVGERSTVADAPTAVKRLFKYGHWVMRPFVRVPGVRDLTSSMRLVRISALRDALRAVGDAPLVTGDSWTANADLLLRLAPHARRVESVPVEPTYGVRMRESRRVAVGDVMSMFKWAWGARGRRVEIGSAPDAGGEGERTRGPRPNGKRREEPEISIERVREKVRERDGTGGLESDGPEGRRRRGRDGERPVRGERASGERPERTERPEAAARPERPERPERAPKPERAERPERGERTERGERRPRGERPERTERPERSEARAEARTETRPDGRTERRAESPRPPRRREERADLLDPALELDDPFAPPARRERLAAETLAESAEDIPLRAEPLAAVPEVPAAPAPRAEAPEHEPLNHLPPTVDAETPGDVDRGADDDIAQEGDEQGAEATELDAEGRPRKRRRNRRSRRGRRRKNGAEGAEGGESPDGDASEFGEAAAIGDAGESGDSDGGDEDTSPRRARRGRETRSVFTPADHIDGEPVDRAASADDEADGDDDDDVAGVESMSEGAPRPRRRGRRGRRGGARRSRGRRGAGEGGEGGEGGDGGDPGPAGDAE